MQTESKSLIERIEAYLAGCAPHVRQRLAAKLLAEALDEVKRLNTADTDKKIPMTLHDRNNAYGRIDERDTAALR